MTRPNVLWLMTDEQRTDSLGCYGSAWARTPNLDRLAAEGVQFDAAVTPAPVCVPARSALLAGRYPSDLGLWHNGGTPARQAEPLTRRFADAGYRTASFGKHHHLLSEDPPFETQVELTLSDEVGYCDYAEGYDHDDFGVVRYPGEPYPWILAGRFPAEPGRTAEAQAVAAARRWLAEPSGKPFFLRVSFNAPHTPVVPPAPFDTCVDPAAVTLPVREELPGGAPEWLRDLAELQSADRLSDEQIRRARAAYYGQVAYVDHLVGDLLAWMDGRSGLLENLLVVFCSDHGTHLGDFGLMQKQTFFEPVVNVPYVYWGPGIVEPRSPVRTPVELRSLLPTLLDLAGVEAHESSLADVVRGAAEPEPRPVFSELTLGSFGIRERDRLVMVRDGPWKLTLRLDPEPCDVVLVDLDADPAERANRADDPSARGVRDRLVALVVEHAG